MSERLRESLSALMDDAADDLELGRILRAMEDEDGDALRATWSRYHLTSALLRGQAPERMQPLPGIDALLRDDAQRQPVAAIGADSARSDMAAAATTAIRPRAWRAVASFAVAASVTAVAVVGWQWQPGSRSAAGMAQESPASQSAPAASGASAAIPQWAASSGNFMPASQGSNGLILQRSLQGVAAAGDTQTGTAEAGKAMQPLELYMLQHTEQRAPQGGSGMTPSARMTASEGSR